MWFYWVCEKGSNLKLYKLHGSSRWVESLACTCKCPPGTHEKLTKTENVNGKIMVTGTPSRLKESQAYTKKMGEAVINAWLDGGDDDPDVSGPDIHKPLPKKTKPDIIISQHVTYEAACSNWEVAIVIGSLCTVLVFSLPVP